jgi:hypothetical protein
MAGITFLSSGCDEEEITVSSDAFYVSTDGDDNNPGTKDQPWASWDKAFNANEVEPGDTVYFRGGIYPMTVSNGDGYTITRGGTKNNWICFCNYPGEVPVLDCSNITPDVRYSQAIKTEANYIILKGLTVRNVFQAEGFEVNVAGFRSQDGHVLFENCTAYNIHGHGFNSLWYEVGSGDDSEHRYVNCDAFNCVDIYAYPPALPGNGGSGFSSFNFFTTFGKTFYKNCRAWKCGDQGFSVSGDNYIEVEGCWSFNNGQLEGDGHGFKLGWVDFPSDKLRRIVRNCIAAYNRQSGICTNDQDYDVVCIMNIYNNTIYHNGFHPNWTSSPYGIIIDKTAGSEESELKRILKNNISYSNESGAVYLGNGAAYTHANNNWDQPPGVSVTDFDFISLDSTGLSGPRNADGSLPFLNFLRLSNKSRLIDAGTNVGIPFLGKAPDLGAFERE